jgi:hypothetical protein
MVGRARLRADTTADPDRRQPPSRRSTHDRGHLAFVCRGQRQQQVAAVDELSQPPYRIGVDDGDGGKWLLTRDHPMCEVPGDVVGVLGPRRRHTPQGGTLSEPTGHRQRRHGQVIGQRD